MYLISLPLPPLHGHSSFPLIAQKQIYRLSNCQAKLGMLG